MCINRSSSRAAGDECRHQLDVAVGAGVDADDGIHRGRAELGAPDGFGDLRGRRQVGTAAKARRVDQAVPRRLGDVESGRPVEPGVGVPPGQYQHGRRVPVTAEMADLDDGGVIVRVVERQVQGGGQVAPLHRATPVAGAVGADREQRVDRPGPGGPERGELGERGWPGHRAQHGVGSGAAEPPHGGTGVVGTTHRPDRQRPQPGRGRDSRGGVAVHQTQCVGRGFPAEARQMLDQQERGEGRGRAARVVVDGQIGVGAQHPRSIRRGGGHEAGRRGGRAGPGLRRVVGRGRRRRVTVPSCR